MSGSSTGGIIVVVVVVVVTKGKVIFVAGKRAQSVSTGVYVRKKRKREGKEVMMKGREFLWD